MESENGATNLRVASFSCYLDTADNNFVHKIKKALEDPTPQEASLQINSGRGKSSSSSVGMVKASINNHISQSPRIASFAHYLDAQEESFAFRSAAAAAGGATNLEKPKSKDGEIDIFGADRYFNMKLGDENDPKREYYTPRSADLPRKVLNLGPPTPSVYSQASSWNSETSLLRNLQRNAAHQVKRKKALGKRFLTSFACTGPCLDRKGVYVTTSLNQGVDYRTKHSQQGSRTNDQDSLMVKTGVADGKVDDDPRQSLEVFGCKGTRKGDLIPANLERKVSTLTWDAIPRADNPTTTTLNSFGTACDDMASDASSDLFEIEHISGSRYGLLTSQVPDNMSSCMSPTTLYAPSEASIEWSVVTASAVDFSSVISDYEERSVSVAGEHLVLRHHYKTDKKNKFSGEKAAAAEPKSRPGGLLGCKSQKAISVAETIHKTSEKVAKHPGMDSYVSLGILQASAKVKDIESIHSQQSFVARGLPPTLLN